MSKCSRCNWSIPNPSCVVCWEETDEECAFQAAKDFDANEELDREFPQPSKREAYYDAMEERLEGIQEEIALGHRDAGGFVI